MPDPRSFLSDLPESRRPAYITIRQEWYPGVREFWASVTSSRFYDAIFGVRAIVIHATAGTNSSGAMSVMRTGKTSWHWLVPDKDEIGHGDHVWACVPEARAARHVRNGRFHPAVNGGADRVNHWSLGIEIVNSQRNGIIDPYSDWQVETTARLVRHCWTKYPNLTQIVSHALLEPDGRSDPGAHFPWERFVQLVISSDEREELPPSVAAATPMVALPDLKPDSRSCCAPA